MDLHKEFVKLSFDIIKMKNRLISLLLEIYEKEIYKLHHCRTIHEYGFKYAKLSKEMVDKVIRTLKHLENKPFLKQAIETQGIHKVAMVATIATPENERIFAKHVENLSKPALFEFSKELRWRQRREEMSDQEGLFMGQTEDAQCNAAGTFRPGVFGRSQSGAPGTPQNGAPGTPQNGAPGTPQFCHAIPSKMTIELDSEMQILFLKFKKKYAKNLSNREALRVMLKRSDEVVGEIGAKADGERGKGEVGAKADGEGDKTEVNKSEAIANMKIKTNAAVINCDPPGNENPVPGNGNQKHHEGANSGKPISKTTFASRYIQKKKDREIRAKYQHKCAYPGCVRTIDAMHHRVPFAFERSHESVIPLCDVHHEFAHNGVISHELKEPEEWTLKITGSKSIYDGFYLHSKPSQKTGG